MEAKIDNNVERMQIFLLPEEFKQELRNIILNQTRTVTNGCGKYNESRNIFQYTRLDYV